MYINVNSYVYTSFLVFTCLSPSSPWIYVSKIADVCPRRLIGDQLAFQEIQSVKICCSPLQGLSIWSNPLTTTIACSMCSISTAT